jgi:hypothetical protein
VVFRSDYPDVEIPESPLAEFVLGRAAERGSRPALIAARARARRRAGPMTGALGA